jgi:hypothetical protein
MKKYDLQDKIGDEEIKESDVLHSVYSPYLCVVVAAGAVPSHVEVLAYELHTAAAALQPGLRQVTLCIVPEQNPAGARFQH